MTRAEPMPQPLHRAWRFGRTPKGLMLLVFLGLAAAALPTTAGPAATMMLGAAIAAAVLEVSIEFGLSGASGFPSGALLTGMFVAGVLSPFAGLTVVVVTALFAILAKHVLRIGGTHVFNPAALALLIAALALGTGQSWWAALPEMGVVGVAILVVSGLFIAQRINKLPMIAAFFAVYFAAFTSSAFSSSPAQVAEVFRAPDLHAALFFAFFMLDDPPTSPVRYRDQVAFGVLVAVGAFAVFIWLGGVYYLFAGLLAGNAVEAARRLVVRWRRSQARMRRDGSAYPVART